MLRGHDPLATLEAQGPARVRMPVAGEKEPWDVLPEGTRVRSTADPTLTGYVKHWEFNKPGILSPIPYCIGWDDDQRAHDVLGLFFVYAGLKGVEPIPAEASV